LSFSGFDILRNQGNYFNLTEQIYERNKDFKDFQFVLVAPIGSENQSKELLKRIAGLTNISGWHLLFANKEEIASYYIKLHLKGSLTNQFGTNMVYIVDKKEICVEERM